MKPISFFKVILPVFVASLNVRAADPTPVTPPSTVPKVPAFSVGYMDRSVSPGTDFYQFADGQWLKNNPVPADKSRWASFSELAERNWYLIHEILDNTARETKMPSHSPARSRRLHPT